MEREIKAYLIASMSLLTGAISFAQPPALPSFLPEYYSAALDIGEQQLMTVSIKATNGVDHMVYTTIDQSVVVSIENIACDRATGRAIFNNILIHLNNRLTNNCGRFAEITDTEAHFIASESNMYSRVFAFILPSSVQIWTFSTQEAESSEIAAKFALIRGFANRQRYAEALAAGNVSMGHWGPQIHDHAIHLFKEGQKTNGLAVLRHHLATSPFDFKAHTEFFRHTDDLVAATNSALVVYNRAENRELINKSSLFLGKKILHLDDFPLLAPDETGLQLVIIPLPPCNPWLLESAASRFVAITGIPVKIRRLKQEWKWDFPERIPRQRTIQGMLVGMKKENLDFENWTTKEMYIAALRDAVKSLDALAKFYMEDLIEKIEQEPGQYRVDSYLDRFCDILGSVRSDDFRTMYVGITEANIYSGDSNYIFSMGRTSGKSRASILSYHMMFGESLGEEHQSRQRLTDRIAKELVPASLKQLRIPRSTDPACPYSYSRGVGRLDQKTMHLSDQVKEAIKELNGN